MSSALYPEALRVSGKGKNIYTTSRRVAQYFEEPHSKVLRVIEKIHDGLKGDNFLQTNYRVVYDQDKRSQMEYHLTKDGFAMLVMSLTGRMATRWQCHMIDAYCRIQADIAALKRMPMPIAGTGTLQ